MNRGKRKHHWEYSQALDDEQGVMHLIGFPHTDYDVARVGIADEPGAYMVARQVGNWVTLSELGL